MMTALSRERGLLQQMVEQRRLAAAQKAGDDA